jgi:type II secretory pathway pseudopilin PulG
MLIVVVAIVLAALAWAVTKWMRHVDPAARRTRLGWVAAGLGAALALRLSLAAPPLLRVALFLLALGALAVWLRGRGQGGDGPGDDEPDPPLDPGPDSRPGHRDAPHREHLDPKAFDRARAEWEHALKKHGPD